MIVVIGGDEKTGKTTMGLSFLKPLHYFEFDIGGFDRAIKMFKNELHLITRKQFPTPLQALTVDKKLVSSKIIIGMKELWYNFLTEFYESCMTPEVQTITIDTWFQVWEMVRLAVLQEKQEAQLDESGRLKKGEERLRTNLLQIEYAEPNARMRNLLFYARGMGKNLVLITYDRDQYKPQLDESGRLVEVRTGKKDFALWGETLKHADVALRLRIDDKSNKPVAQVVLPGLLPIEAVGTEIDNFYDSLENLLKIYR